MLDLIRVFIQTVQCGSFTKAGTALSMAPSSIARNIDSLEALLGVSLFKRSTRALLLTDDGMVFLEGASKLLSDADGLVAGMNRVNQEPEGLLKISVFGGFGRLVISPLLPEFLRRYPKVSIEIELENTMVDLNSENIDIGIRIGRPVDSSLRAKVLRPNTTLVAASPSYVAQFGLPKTPQELAGHNCLLLNRDRQRTYWYFDKGKQSIKVPVQGNLSSKGGTPLIEAAIAGGGILQLSSWMMVDLIASGQLVECLPHWRASLNQGSSGDIYAVYQGSKYPRPAVRAFLDFLGEQLT